MDGLDLSELDAICRRSVKATRPQICSWLGVNTIKYTIAPYTPLPDLESRFDLVTAFACPFNYLESDYRLWTMPEWSFFFDDLRDHALKPAASP